MLHRIFGALIAILSVYALYLAGRALSGGADFTEFMVTLAETRGLSVDRVDFLAHWRVVGVLVAFFAVLGVVAGIAMFLLRPWSWLLVAGIALVSLVLSVAGSIAGYSRYAFERFEKMESLALLAVAAVALYAYRKSKHVHASNA
jgi:hypothetical protein